MVPTQHVLVFFPFYDVFRAWGGRGSRRPCCVCVIISAKHTIVTVNANFFYCYIYCEIIGQHVRIRAMFSCVSIGYRNFQSVLCSYKIDFIGCT